MFQKTLVASVVLVAVGCAAVPSQFVGKNPSVPTPTCKGATDCEAKWSAARAYLIAHMSYGLQNDSVDRLETYDPPEVTMGLRAKVTRQLEPDGSFAIVAKFFCNNLIECRPNADKTLEDFNRTLGAMTPAGSAPPSTASQPSAPVAPAVVAQAPAPTPALVPVPGAAPTTQASMQPCAPTANAQGAVIDTVKQMFVAVQADDAQKLAAITTPDFYAYDAGQRFTAQTLMQTLEKLRAAGNRYEWNVTEPEAHISCNTALVTYVNRGSITNASGQQYATWLESVVLEYGDQRWRIRFLHSSTAAGAK